VDVTPQQIEHQATRKTMPYLTDPNGASPAKQLPKLAPAQPTGDTGTAAGSDSESDAELASYIHPDLLLQHQNQLTLQHQAHVCHAPFRSSTLQMDTYPHFRTSVKM